MKEVKLEVTIAYDYVIYDGTNADKLYKLVTEHNLIDQSDSCHSDSETPGMSVRPKDIPNLDEAELLKWWESSGEWKTESGPSWCEPRRWNTHNSNNMPLWRKDEEVCLAFYDRYHDGYLQLQWLRKNDAVVVYPDGDYEIHHTVSEDALNNSVISQIKNHYGQFSWS